MLPIDAFRSKITSPLGEENAQEEVLDAMFLAVGQQAKDLISKIVAEGAEEVLDKILRDSPDLDRISSQATPDENSHERLDDENHVIFWSKSGIEPFVGVYQKTNPMGTDIERTGESEMFEEPIKEIDMEAIEAASHFLLRGIDEDTVGRVVADACKGCVQTDEAINKIRDIIREDPRLDGYALDEDEVAGLNEYRHQLRKQFLGNVNKEILNQSLYEASEDEVELAKQIAADAAQDLEDAENDADRENGINSAKSDLGLDGDEDDEALFEGDVDPNKGSQMAGYRHSGGPQALGSAISQMQWDGPGGIFDKLLNAIDIEGYNMIGNVAKAQATGEPVPTAPVDPAAQANPEVAAPQATSPQAEPNQELDGLELPSI